MSNCTGCYHAFGDKPNPHMKECEICIRNPKYPTMKMPEMAVINNITLKVPQDMYIARDRKNYEEKILMKKLKELIQGLAQKRELQKKKPHTPYPYPDLKPWEYYWDYIHRTKVRWQECLNKDTLKKQSKK